ncbi:MAG: hypothetical protein HGA80_09550, partial [Candidatus Omnitrophica bacterium]|nr:hypothetical protein [Candidatus Omnitrophota bacterium]
MAEFFRRALRLLGVWLVILVIFVAVAELACRFLRNDGNPLAQVAQKRADVLFTPSSSFHSISSVPGEFEYDAHLNRYGYRGRDFSMPKPAGVKRIFAVGDSFTFGVGSPDGQTIPALLEADLNARGYPVEVVNAGIGGSSPVSNYVNLRDIHLKYQPDLVVFLFDLTDLWDDWYYERQAVVDGSGEIVRFDPMFRYGKRDWWTTATYYSAFCRYFNNKVVRTLGKMRVLGVGGYLKTVREGKRAKAVIAGSTDERARKSSIEYDGVLFMRGREREDLIREHWPRTQKYILKMRDLLARRGIPLVIVMYPHGIYVDGDQWNDGRKTWGFEPGRKYTDHLPFELMTEFARNEKIPFVNTLDAFLAAPRAQYFFNWDGHMTSAGNRIVA